MKITLQYNKRSQYFSISNIFLSKSLKLHMKNNYKLEEKNHRQFNESHYKMIEHKCGPG